MSLMENSAASAADDPVLHDLMATNWLTTYSASATQSFVSDDAPQNTYAQVRVDCSVGQSRKLPPRSRSPPWTPHESSSTTYSRDQLDAAFQAMLAEGQKATAQRQSSYLASQVQAGTSADFSS